MQKSLMSKCLARLPELFFPFSSEFALLCFLGKLWIISFFLIIFPILFLLYFSFSLSIVFSNSFNDCLLLLSLIFSWTISTLLTSKNFLAFFFCRVDVYLLLFVSIVIFFLGSLEEAFYFPTRQPWVQILAFSVYCLLRSNPSSAMQRISQMRWRPELTITKTIFLFVLLLHTCSVLLDTSLFFSLFLQLALF